VGTHEITEREPGVFYTRLEPCSVAVLPHVLAPAPSHVWVVDHWPDPAFVWRDMPVPLTADGQCEQLRVRLIQYDFQMPAQQFLGSVLPRLSRSDGIILLQLDRPVDDSLHYRRVTQLPDAHAVLRRAGWRLTFELKHGGDFGEVTAASRAELERVLADPVVAAGKTARELP